MNFSTEILATFVVNSADIQSKPMSKETILVTGGTGFIGSHTTVELQEAGYEVVIVDNLSNSDESVLDGIERITGLRPKFYKSDCNDLEAMRRVYEENPTIVGVIHFAASKAVGESVEKPVPGSNAEDVSSVCHQPF